MTVYYRGRDLLITHEVFAVFAPEPRAFPIRELRGVHIVQEPVRRVAAPAVVVPAAAVAVGVALPVFGAPSQLLGVLIALAAVSVAGVACLRERPRPHELRAVLQGRAVRLFRTTDRQTFGQVRRALLRALEDAGVTD